MKSSRSAAISAAPSGLAPPGRSNPGGTPPGRSSPGPAGPGGKKALSSKKPGSMRDTPGQEWPGHAKPWDETAGPHARFPSRAPGPGSHGVKASDAASGAWRRQVRRLRRVVLPWHAAGFAARLACRSSIGRRAGCNWQWGGRQVFFFFASRASSFLARLSSGWTKLPPNPGTLAPTPHATFHFTRTLKGRASTSRS